MPLQTGQVFNNRYRIVKLLGQGGFGAVYRAWDSNLNKPCALKENLDVSPEAQRQFTREATVLANLSHPNLPRVTDHFILPGQGQYLVMDFVDGDDLASILRQRGPVPPEQAIAWTLQVADALSYLHTRQPPVVHRDIKPANIRLTPDGRAMLVDFGLVKIYNAQLRTTLGARAVTPGYAPPEQYGHGSTDARSDLYALGATLYNILTGQDPLESVQRMSGAQMRPVNQINPRINPAVGAAIERAMRLDPNQRFQTVAEFKAALSAPAAPAAPVFVKPVPEAYAQPVVRAPVNPTAAMRPVVSAAAPPMAYPTSAPKSERKIGVWVGVGVVVLLCLVGSLIVAGLVASSQNQSAQKTSDAQVEATLVQRVMLTSTSLARVTATAQAQTTRAAVLSNIEASRTLVYGPTSGALEHSDTDQISAQDSGVNLRDFIVEARLFNPYSTSQGAWDYGFILRHAEKNTHFRFVIKSEKSWVLVNNSGDPDGVIIAQGDLPALDVSENGSNLVKLIFHGDRGWFFLNGEMITELDLSARMNPGAIFIATGIFQGDGKPGSTTRYADFSIWSLQ
jgi:serine/threonine-protein kinase